MKLSLILLLCLAYNMLQAQSDTALKEYTGQYKFPDGSAAPSVEISIVDGALFASATIGSAAMVRQARDTFSIPSYNGMAYFFRDGAGKVNRIRVEVSDLILEGDKQGGQSAIRRHPYRLNAIKIAR